MFPKLPNDLTLITSCISLSKSYMSSGAMSCPCNVSITLATIDNPRIKTSTVPIFNTIVTMDILGMAEYMYTVCDACRHCLFLWNMLCVRPLQLNSLFPIAGAGRSKRVVVIIIHTIHSLFSVRYETTRHYLFFSLLPLHAPQKSDSQLTVWLIWLVPSWH